MPDLASRPAAILPCQVSESLASSSVMPAATPEAVAAALSSASAKAGAAAKAAAMASMRQTVAVTNAEMRVYNLPERFPKDALREAKAAGKPWTKALAFDYSLAIGEWTNGEWAKGEWLMSPEEAIVEASKVMTIRQGDLIYIQADCEPRRVQKEEVLRIEVDGEEKLYCKIK